ncbi:hypothetical protein HO133_009579 [Letharia lupina]|uniref:DUF3669 domain-containing protein n=1 Tax=Letharia lupina TaxID=560253 RepID=A0A8H6CLR4_9LECA|nr:uncharacterized protein HO133_009579 [Letharia lupina]KAF6225579.1 hypothetical protein HO133_009579 [Letharia lupina]
MIQDAFPENTIPKTPSCNFFRTPGSDLYWKANINKFPASHREIGAAFQYFDDEIREEARNDKENEACLIRIYLGENETGNEDYHSLRNFPMRLSMVKKLDLDKTLLADEMAIALAIIHWQAQVDAMDAEFVLRKCSSNAKPHEVDVLPLEFNKRSINVWVLDFDKSSRIELTSNDVDKYLVPALIGNDPYYPRPDVDTELWTQFSKTYLKASRLVLRNKQVSSQAMELPEIFLDKVASKIKEHEGWDPEEHIVFG